MCEKGLLLLLLLLLMLTEKTLHAYEFTIAASQFANYFKSMVKIQSSDPWTHKWRNVLFCCTQKCIFFHMTKTAHTLRA